MAITKHDIRTIRTIYKRGKENADIEFLFGKVYVNGMICLNAGQFKSLLHKGLIAQTERRNHYVLSSEALDLIGVENVE